MDLTSTKMFRWEDIPTESVTDQISRKVITGEKVMMAHIWLKKGAVVPLHSHEAEQLSYTMTGALKFIINGQTVVARPNQMLEIPSWVPHEAVAEEDTYEMDVFSPIRHDWLNHTDTYFSNAPTQPAGLDNPAGGDYPARLHEWSEVPVEKLNDHIERSYVTAARATFCDFLLRKGGVVPTHQHPAEQLTWVRSGHLRLTVDGTRFDVTAGSVIRIPSNLPHMAEVVEESRVIDVFSPRREDWISKTDDYLRQGNR